MLCVPTWPITGIFAPGEKIGFSFFFILSTGIKPRPQPLSRKTTQNELQNWLWVAPAWSLVCVYHERRRSRPPPPFFFFFYSFLSWRTQTREPAVAPRSGAQHPRALPKAACERMLVGTGLLRRLVTDAGKYDRACA